MSYGLRDAKRLAATEYLRTGKRLCQANGDDGGTADAIGEESKKYIPRDGRSSYSHTDKICAKGNDVYFYSDINDHSYFKLNMVLKETIRNMQILALDHGLEKPPPIKLHISSYGGLVFGGLSVVDTIKSSPVEIHSIVEGYAASAATFISIVCKKRYIRPHAFMLVHQMSSGVWGTATEIMDAAENIKRITSVTEEMYTNHTTMSRASLRRLKKHDLWMKPGECLDKGLVDEILK